ncbi:hypothetical protein [Aneurinibacillus tyrosinisolvens]|uniref:hypothetical protein n=1 Tax=Aneurinibacillus tyrosinisolvens TaxID=1443435 RepID=UPI000A522EAD|nr:hypothetical protein [Aneurinibacillus tyrosinisolvens]
MLIARGRGAAGVVVEITIQSAEIPEKQTRLLHNNPRTLRVKDVEAIYRAAY